MKKIFILMMAAVLSTGAMAQSKSGKGNFDPTTRAEQMTERMASELSLTDAQKTKVLALNKAQMQTRSEAMKSANDDRTKAMEAMKAQREEYEAKLKTILTTEQYEKYTKNQAERTSKGNKGKK